MFESIRSILILRKHSEQQAETHHSLVPLRDPSLDSVASIVIASSQPLEPCYVELQSHLDTLPLYEPACINEFAPSDRYLRRKYISQLSLSVDVYIYRMAYGGSIGTVTFVWKINQKLSDHEHRNALTLTAITKMLPKYATRDMKNTFIKKYAEVSKTPKMVLRNIFRELTSDPSAASSSDEAEIDDRVAHFVLLADDPDVILDLRVLNGQPGSTRFDLFWNECQKFFDEHVAAVSERRHGEYLYLPFAISVEDLLQQVKARLPVDTPIPSSEWLRLQFWPTDPYTARALHHTGRFGIKFKVQSRLIRADHPDAKYAAMQYKYLKHFAVKHQKYCLMISLDDKATVPVGEPEQPQSTGVRGHNQSLALVDGPALSALDHDFHLAGIIPSVPFVLVMHWIHFSMAMYL